MSTDELLNKLMQMLKDDIIDDFSLEPGIFPRGFEANIQKDGEWIMAWDVTPEGALTDVMGRFRERYGETN